MEEYNIIRVSNKTNYDKSTYVKLNNSLFIKKFIGVSIACLFVLAIGIIMIALDFSKVFGYIYIGFGAFAPLFFFLMFKLSVAKAVKTSERINGKVLVVNYDFYDNFITISSSDEKHNFNNKMYYTDYFKYIETKEYFFLLVSKNQAHCISKSGFSNEESINIARSLLDNIKLNKKGNKK